MWGLCWLRCYNMVYLQQKKELWEEVSTLVSMDCLQVTELEQIPCVLNGHQYLNSVSCYEMQATEKLDRLLTYVSGSVRVKLTADVT